MNERQACYAFSEITKELLQDILEENKEKLKGRKKYDMTGKEDMFFKRNKKFLTYCFDVDIAAPQSVIELVINTLRFARVRNGLPLGATLWISIEWLYYAGSSILDTQADVRKVLDVRVASTRFWKIGSMEEELYITNMALNMCVMLGNSYSFRKEFIESPEKAMLPYVCSEEEQRKVKEIIYAHEMGYHA